ncbi:MAG: carbohydrate ABC transporter permease [Spirochaetia bacterium]|jgi:sn-glycerol 3-phosphate transport system permease protein|nr:carbohydrate ABC transporter permease [Spirochaetia bacterium]
MTHRKRLGQEDRPWVHVVLVAACFFVCFPMLFAIIKATQTREGVITPSLALGGHLIDNIRTVWTQYDLGMYMRNSFFISLWVTAGKIVLSLLAATAIVFYDFRGKKVVFGLIIVTLMFPTEILILGLFQLVSNKGAPTLAALLQWMFNPKEFFLAPTKYGFGWGDTKLGVIFPFLASATGVFLFRQQFLTIPRSLVDSARMDGANSLQFLARILVPMSLNTIGALTVIQFVYVWDQYIWPRVVIRQNANQVIQVGLNSIISAGDSIMWNHVMAGAVLAMVPPLLVFALLYNAFMNGYALSSNK